MGRREDIRLITGQGRYTSDWNLPKQLYAVFLRSDRSHAEIRRFDAIACGCPGTWHSSLHDHPVPTPINALGAKGVGESGCSGSLPALANATTDALRPLGIARLDMPFTPARLWAVIQRARRAKRRQAKSEPKLA